MKYNSSKKCASFQEKFYKSLYNTFNSPESQIYSNIKVLSKDNNQNICKNHNKFFDIYCFTCSKDICPKCLNAHSYHRIIKYKDIISPSKEEINILKKRIKFQKAKHCQLLYEIKKWEKILEKKISYLEKIFSARNIIDFINHVENNGNDIKNIIKFKEIYSLVICQELNCNMDYKNKDNLEYLNHEHHILCKCLVDQLNKNPGEFVKNGIEIIKFLSEIPINNKDSNINYNLDEQNILTLKLNVGKLKENENPNEENIYKSMNNSYSIRKANNNNSPNSYNIFNSYNAYNEHLRLYNSNINDYKYSTSVENINRNKKYISNEMNNSFTSNNSNSNKDYSTYNNINNNFNNNHFNNTIYSFYNKKNKYYKNLYSKKLVNSVLRISNSQTKLNQSANIESRSLFDFKYDNNNDFYSDSKLLSIDLPPRRKEQTNISLVSKRKDINSKDNNFNNSINNPNYKKAKKNEMKYFTHKKFSNNDKNYDSINNSSVNNYKKSNTEKPKITNYKNNSLLIAKKFNSSPIKSTLFIATPQNYANNMNLNKNNEIEEEKDFCIRIVKTKEEKKFKINPNKPLCIGFNLDNSNCKLSIVDQNSNDIIQLICFKKDEYDIPTIIYLDENSDDIKIGYEAKNLIEKYPTQTVFDLITLFGANFEEISNKKKFWPFQLYKEANGRIYIKLNYCGKKNKKFYIENLMILFFEQLFRKFFDKIIVEEDELKPKSKYDLNALNINICITVPSYFSYIKRKVLEKIFQKHIFQNMIINFNYNYDLNNNFSVSSSKQSIFSTCTNINNLNHSNNKINKNKILDINLNNIKIENAPNPAVLCFQNNNSEDSISSSFSFQSCTKENNILILNISDDSTNISITSITNEKKQIRNNGKNKYIKKYEVKNISGYNFGQEDFIKNYLYQKLKEIDINLYNDISKSPKELLKIQKEFETIIKLFDGKPENKIVLKKLFNNYDYSITLNEQDYIKSNTALFNKIISSIKTILKQSKLSEIQIDDIVLIGRASKSGYMKKILSEIFKNNKIIHNKFLNIHDNNFENDEHYLVSGAALEAMNTNLKPISKKYLFLDICPISFGIENSNGEVDLIIKKGNKVPITQKNFVKIYRKKDTDFVDIKICEINNDNKKVVLSCSNINGKNMKIFDNNDQNENEFVELLFEFEIDENFNLSVFILDRQTFKRRFEFSINIDVIKDKDKDKDKEKIL